MEARLPKSRKAKAAEQDALTRFEAALRAQAQAAKAQADASNAAADALHDLICRQPSGAKLQTSPRRPRAMRAPPEIPEDDPTPQERAAVRDKLRRLGIG